MTDIGPDWVSIVMAGWASRWIGSAAAVIPIVENNIAEVTTNESARFGFRFKFA